MRAGRHVIALLCFALLCAGAMVHFEGGVGFVLVCVCFVLPVAAAVWAWATSAWDERRSEAEQAAAREEARVESALPPGVEWVYPEHVPGDCGGPEDDEGVED